MLYTNTDRAWERWGQQDPYYAVHTRDEYRKENLAGSLQAFFDNGQQHISQVITEIETRFRPLRRQFALDFGCGVGRLMIPLSAEFARVDGIDISPSMLREASSNLTARGITNTELMMSDDALTAIEGREYDLIHTYVVLQHIPPTRGYALIDHLLAHVRLGGAFYVHVSLQRMQSPLRRAVYFAKHQVPFAYLAFNLLQRRQLREMPMQMNHYDFNKLSEIFHSRGFGSVVIRTEIHKSPSGLFLTAGFSGQRT